MKLANENLIRLHKHFKDIEEKDWHNNRNYGEYQWENGNYIGGQNGSSKLKKSISEMKISLGVHE